MRLVRLLGSMLAAVAIMLLAYRVWVQRPWTEWRRFSTSFIADDGRAVDPRANDRSTSQAQSEALFFALVANDRDNFDSLLQWTRDALAGGDLTRKLPAASWGRRSGATDGDTGVLDANPASGADLWLAYDLLQAGRLWRDKDYEHLGHAVLNLISAREVQILPGGGALLLPSPQGFQTADGGWRLHPSDLPGFIAAALVSADPAGPWGAIRATQIRNLSLLLRHGAVPDWYVVDAHGAPRFDEQTGATGSGDAMRTYLWAGMTAAVDDPGLLQLLSPFAGRLGAEPPPASVDAGTGAITGEGPPGFSAALLPMLSTLDRDDAAAGQLARLRRLDSADGGATSGTLEYSDQVLRLYGEGWLHRRYRFAAGGQLVPRWEMTCCGVWSN